MTIAKYKSENNQVLPKNYVEEFGDENLRLELIMRFPYFEIIGTQSKDKAKQISKVYVN